MSATTTQLLSSGEFCKLRYDTIKVHLQTCLSIPIIEKCQILSWDTLVANEIYVNLQEPCVLYVGRAYRYPPNVAFYIFFSTNISGLEVAC